MSLPTNLPNPPVRLVAEYMKRVPNRPGFLPLVANGYEECGHTLLTVARAAYPLIFDTGVDGYDYAIAGTGFLARFRDRLYLITAKHCLGSGSCDDLRVACNPSTKTFLPLRALHRAHTLALDKDFTDLAIFEAKPEILSQEEQLALNYLDLNKLSQGRRFLESAVHLAVPGFPKELNRVDFDKAKLIEQRYIPSGSYDGPTSDAHIHAVRFAELNQVASIDGMSGSPLIIVKKFEDAHYFSFAGMLIRGGKEALVGRFIESPVILHALAEIDSMPPAG